MELELETVFNTLCIVWCCLPYCYKLYERCQPLRPVRDRDCLDCFPLRRCNKCYFSEDHFPPEEIDILNETILRLQEQLQIMSFEYDHMVFCGERRLEEVKKELTLDMQQVINEEQKRCFQCAMIRYQAELKYEHACEISRLKNERTLEISKLKTKHISEMSKLMIEHTSEISKINNEHARITDPKGEHAREVSKLKNEHTCEVSKLKNEHACEVSRFKYKHTCKVSTLESKRAREVSKLNRQISELNHEVSDLKREVLEQKEQLISANYVCVVCQDNKRDILLLPCGHFCLCRDCLSKVKTCPVCSKPIESSETVYVS